MAQFPAAKTQNSKLSKGLNLDISIFRRFLQASGAHLYGILPQIAVSSEE